MSRVCEGCRKTESVPGRAKCSWCLAREAVPEDSPITISVEWKNRTIGRATIDLATFRYLLLESVLHSITDPPKEGGR